MNKKSKIILTLLIILIIVIGIFILIKNENDINQDNYSNIANIQDESNENITTKYEIKDLGTIECEKIGLNAPIKETVDLDVLSTAVGHFEDTALYNGNVCLAGHNSGTNKNGEDIGFFKKLNELEIGDEIKYHHMFGQYIYKVSEIKEIEETDVSVLESTSSDKLTLITCIKNKSKLRLCVICDRI
ncbi:MAG: class D sortase [Clostridiales bacterium]|nr:class D sortase [Clostridiales bacterium]